MPLCGLLCYGGAGSPALCPAVWAHVPKFLRHCVSINGSQSIVLTFSLLQQKRSSSCCCCCTRLRDVHNLCLCSCRSSRPSAFNTRFVANCLSADRFSTMPTLIADPADSPLAIWKNVGSSTYAQICVSSTQSGMLFVRLRLPINEQTYFWIVWQTSLQSFFRIECTIHCAIDPQGLGKNNLHVSSR